MTAERPWRGKPVTPSSYVADDGELRELDAAHFCAAGALLWHEVSGGEPRMLLAVERRGETTGAKANFLGGKRDSWAETPRAVAARECWEETGYLLSSAAHAAIEGGARPVAWAPQSKFALFLHELGPEDADLVARISALGGPPNLDAEHTPT